MSDENVRDFYRQLLGAKAERQAALIESLQGESLPPVSPPIQLSRGPSVDPEPADGPPPAEFDPYVYSRLPLEEEQ
jgi:hypothetical protein